MLNRQPPRLAFASTTAALLMLPFSCCTVPSLPASLPVPLGPAACSAPIVLPIVKGLFLDIPYLSPGSTDNHLDLHVPPAGITGPATILYIHGGSWIGGDKGDTSALCDLLAAGGYPVVTCNYTLSTLDAPGFPQAVYDVKAVVGWIRTIGAAFYGLPKKVVVVGESAGGHLALMLGATAGVQVFEPLTPPPGGYGVDAVITFFAPGDLLYHAQHGFDNFATALFLGGLLSEQMLPIYQEASPINYVSSANPPIALFHGMADATVPVEDAVRMREAIANVCRYCRLYLVPDATHGFDGFGGIGGVAQDITMLIPRLLADTPGPDLNGDGAVDTLDIGLFVRLLVDPDAFFSEHPGCDRLQADLNGDGQVDGLDVAFMVGRILGVAH